jgi:hypothetical protein
MVNVIEALFPRLRGGNYRVTSPPDTHYNCIAWAAGDTRRWWWPERDIENGHWPAAAIFAVSRDAFVQAFATLGFAVCAGEGYENGYERIALYAGQDGLPTHAARQLQGGRWTSKLGNGEDIEHDLRDLEGDMYGRVVQFMKRLTSVA